MRFRVLIGLLVACLCVLATEAKRGLYEPAGSPGSTLAKATKMTEGRLDLAGAVASTPPRSSSFSYEAVQAEPSFVAPPAALPALFLLQQPFLFRPPPAC